MSQLNETPAPQGTGDLENSHAAKHDLFNNTALSSLPQFTPPDIETAAKALGGEVSGRSVILAPGPARWPGDRSLTVSFDQEAPAIVRFRSYYADDPIACVEHIRCKLGLSPSVRLKDCSPKIEYFIDDLDFLDAKIKHARELWNRREAIEGTVGERVLRECYKYTGPLPPTVGLLRPSSSAYPSMIAAAGFPDELGHGKLNVRESDVRAVHLTRLMPDGSGTLCLSDAESMAGFDAMGYFPVVIRSHYQSSTLAITADTASALTLSQLTRSGVWAAGRSRYMTTLCNAVPPSVRHVDVVSANERDFESASTLCMALNAVSIEADMKALRHGRGGGVELVRVEPQRVKLDASFDMNRFRH